MASDVDICNLALALLGDKAAVASIDPADPSAQAQYCSRFYPIARNALEAMHEWGFLTVRRKLSLLASNPSSTWKYAYGAPSDVLSFISVLANDARDDYSEGLILADTLPGSIDSALGVFTPVEFQVEATEVGSSIILTDQKDAVLRYTHLSVNASVFPPLFVTGLALLLSGYLAGPLIKGGEGRNAAIAQMRAFDGWKSQAVVQDTSNRRILPKPSNSMLVNR